MLLRDFEPDPQIIKALKIFTTEYPILGNALTLRFVVAARSTNESAYKSALKQVQDVVIRVLDRENAEETK